MNNIIVYVLENKPEENNIKTQETEIKQNNACSRRIVFGNWRALFCFLLLDYTRFYLWWGIDESDYTGGVLSCLRNCDGWWEGCNYSWKTIQCIHRDRQNIYRRHSQREYGKCQVGKTNSISILAEWLKRTYNFIRHMFDWLIGNIPWTWSEERSMFEN